MELTPDEFAAKLEELKKAVGEVAPRKSIDESAEIVKRNIRALVHSKSGKFGVTSTVTGGSDSWEALVLPTGRFALIERDTRPHVEPAAAKAVVAFGGSVYSRVNHPGTRGQHPFERGSKAAEAEVGRVFETNNRAAVDAVF